MPRRSFIAVLPCFLAISYAELALAAGPADQLGDRFNPDTIVAKVGDMVVLYGDVTPLIDWDLAPVIAKATNKDKLTELKTYREERIRNLTRELAYKKLRYLEFRRVLALKVKDDLPRVEMEIKEVVKSAFDKALTDARERMNKATTKEEIDELMTTDFVLPRLALLMKEKNLQTMAQLDEALRALGSSLEKQETLFREHHLGQKAMLDKLKEVHQREVTKAEMLDYYENHADARRVPFEEAQLEIKRTIIKDRRTAKIIEILTDLKKATPIWTIYDDEENAALQTNEKVQR